MWERGLLGEKAIYQRVFETWEEQVKWVIPEAVFSKSWRGPKWHGILRGAESLKPIGWLSGPSLWRLTCGGLCSEHKSLVCPGSLGLAVASAGAQPRARPRLWGRPGACKGERASSPEENKEAKSGKDARSGVLSTHDKHTGQKVFLSRSTVNLDQCDSNPVSMLTPMNCSPWTDSEASTVHSGLFSWPYWFMASVYL